MAKIKEPMRAQVGLKFTGELATRLIAIKNKSGLSVRKINELMVANLLPRLEDGTATIVSDAAGTRIVEEVQ